MREERSDAGGGAEREIATPARELRRLDREGSRLDAALRGRVERAVLEAAGEFGYPALTVARVLERSGASRSRFYKLFANKGECYAVAYELAIDRLSAELLEAAGEEASWRAGLRRALAELAGFVEERPLAAKGLLAEVHVAGGPAMAKRKEVFERLSRALDSARRETKSRHSPPPIAAEFIVSAIEESLVSALARGVPEEFPTAVPSLTYLAVSVYFGEEAAGEELETKG